MRIFKNRGDIFFSKTDKERSKEQKLLITGLVLIVSFTVVFVSFIGARYNFSAKEFFKPDGLELTTAISGDDNFQIPEMAGKSNFAVLVNEDNQLLFAYILQVDLDNVSYKICTLKANTSVNASNLASIFASSGAEKCANAVGDVFDTRVDYYISMTREQYEDLYNAFGNIEYPIINEIKYKNNELTVPLNVKIKAGSQSLKGSQIVNLIRYYIDVEGSISIANDIFLNILSGQMNTENYNNAQDLFQKIVTSSQTNITVREYSESDAVLAALSDYRVAVKVYNVPISYNNNEITSDSLATAKGYFVE